jgi:hypothetical protein
LLAGWSISTAGQLNVLSRATATISGKISFEGTPPPNNKVQMSSDPFCQMHAADYPTVETTKVSDGGQENVIVYVSNGLPSGVSCAPWSEQWTSREKRLSRYHMHRGFAKFGQIPNDCPNLRTPRTK